MIRAALDVLQEATKLEEEVTRLTSEIARLSDKRSSLQEQLRGDRFTEARNKIDRLTDALGACEK